MVALADRGGEVLTSYAVEWDAGTTGATWAYLQGFASPDLSTTISINSGVTPGLSYQVRVYAQNRYGTGPVSLAATIKAAREPGEVSQPSMSSTANGLDVDLAWTAPTDNQQALTAYRILILEADGDYSEQIPECDGTDAGVLATASCTLSHQTLRAAPYLLQQGGQVLFTVAAQNSYGWGATSQLNTATAALVETEPATPLPPVEILSGSTLTSFALSWPGITGGSTDTGGSPVTSYHLQMRALPSGAWTDVQG